MRGAAPYGNLTGHLRDTYGTAGDWFDKLSGEAKGGWRKRLAAEAVTNKIGHCHIANPSCSHSITCTGNTRFKGGPVESMAHNVLQPNMLLAAFAIVERLKGLPHGTDKT